LHPALHDAGAGGPEAEVHHPQQVRVEQVFASATPTQSYVRPRSCSIATAALRPVGLLCVSVSSGYRPRNLVHRDVKPANIVLTLTGAKVVDFGLAAVAGQHDIDEDGELLGTPAYLAPERLTGDEVLSASDVYALGLLTHQALTGSLPWEADTPTQMIKAHIYIQPAPLPSVPGVRPEVNEICGRCLAKEPADRPSAEEVAAVLSAAAGIIPPPADDLPEPEPLPTRIRLARLSADATRALLTAAPAAPSRESNPGSSAGTGSADGAVAPPVAAPEVTPERDRSRRRRAAVVLVPATVVAAVAVAVALTRSDTPVADNLAQVPSHAPATEPVSSPVSAGSTGPIRPAATEPVVPIAPPPSAAAGPRPMPSPSPTIPPAPGSAVRSYGGVAWVVCNGKKPVIVRLDVTPGYTVEDYRPGPADGVKAVLVSSANKSEINIKCSNGAPAASIKETPVKP
jgi:serine/threonine-protein kinase